MLGAVVLVIAIIALRQPSRHVSGSSATRTIVHTIAPRSTGSTTGSTSPSVGGGKSTGSSSESSGSGSDSPASGDPKSVPLLVLNNTTITGLAREAAQRFESGGWTVTRYDNYTNDIISTCAYYDPDTPAAKAAALALREQYPTIKRVEPRFAALPAGPVVVVLTPDYSAE